MQPWCFRPWISISLIYRRLHSTFLFSLSVRHQQRWCRAPVGPAKAASHLLNLRWHSHMVRRTYAELNFRTAYIDIYIGTFRTLNLCRKSQALLHSESVQVNNFWFTSWMILVDASRVPSIVVVDDHMIYCTPNGFGNILHGNALMLGDRSSVNSSWYHTQRDLYVIKKAKVASHLFFLLCR